MSTETELNRLFWHSRRGMLELDELLVPFVRDAYTGLYDGDTARYENLLTCAAQDIFGWFMRRNQPEDPDLQRIVEKILEYSRNTRKVV